MEKQQGLLILYKHKEIFDELEDEEAGQLIKAIFNYELNNEMPKNKLIKMAMLPIKQVLDLNKEKYQKIVERNRENGKKGGRPKNQENPLGFLETEDNPKNLKYKDKYKNKDKDKNIDNTTINIIVDYQNNIGSCSPYIYEQLTDLEKQYGSLKVQQAIYRAVEQGKRTLNYIKGILNQWGDKNWEQILKDEDEFKNKKQPLKQKWSEKETKKVETTPEELKELEDMFKSYK